MKLYNIEMVSLSCNGVFLTKEQPAGGTKTAAEYLVDGDKFGKNGIAGTIIRIIHCQSRKLGKRKFRFFKGMVVYQGYRDQLSETQMSAACQGMKTL